MNKCSDGRAPPLDFSALGVLASPTPDPRSLAAASTRPDSTSRPRASESTLRIARLGDRSELPVRAPGLVARRPVPPRAISILANDDRSRSSNRGDRERASGRESRRGQAGEKSSLGRRDLLDFCNPPPPTPLPSFHHPVSLRFSSPPCDFTSPPSVAVCRLSFGLDLPLILSIPGINDSLYRRE